MFNKSCLVGALFAAVVAHDISTMIKRHSAAQTFLDAEAEFKKAEAARIFQIMHLCRLIDNHKIKIDEFDMIVLNFPYEA